MVGFEQATIKVEKEAEFEELKNTVDQVFQPGTVERFLKELRKRNLRVRDWDAIVAGGILERVGQKMTAGKAAQGLYDLLTVSDRAQIREFYLFRVEEVDPKLRTKFHKIYQYY
ncbi:MAG: hypothetical protein JOZ80_13485 [Acidobacteriaceae bacterium]|nr:hypothetical protein [Acidobacteriaceae bacterium]